MTFDFKKPDYTTVMQDRALKLEWIRQHPDDLPTIKRYYRQYPADFISDWGWTYEPRNAEIGLPTHIPFVLFERQREWIDWVIAKWQRREHGLCEKSRDVGASWLAMALSCTLCLFNRGIAIGFGSRKTEYVDKIGTLKPLLPKARFFMQNLPEEFVGDWKAWRDAPYMRITFPDTNSFIGGEGGDAIGRGDRTSIYFVDEAAHLDRPELIDAALSQTTNCRIDMSSVNGMNNPFAKKRHEGKIDVFIFDWHDDPRKDDAWYAKQCETLDPVVVAQEIDRDYSASVHGIVIPGVWVRACLDARQKLGIAPSGEFALALDIADEGADKNAMVGGRGIEISVAEEWSGKGSDIFHTVERAFEIADEHGCRRWRYDADGLGAGARGDGRVINERRAAARMHPHKLIGFRGSEAVADPDGIVEGTLGSEGDPGRTNKDYFLNRKAQGWWTLRKRIQRTYRWVVEGKQCHGDEIFSIDSKMKNAQKLVAELSQATYSQNQLGKMVINKKPDGMRSPNLADGVVIRFAPIGPQPLNITPEMVQAVRRLPPRLRL